MLSNGLNISLLKIKQRNLKLTADAARKELNLPKKKHRLFLVYSDGTCHYEDYDEASIYKAIAYNMLFRNCSLIVDGVIVFACENMTISDVIERRKSLVLNEVPLSIPKRELILARL